MRRKLTWISILWNRNCPETIGSDRLLCVYFSFQSFFFQLDFNFTCFNFVFVVQLRFTSFEFKCTVVAFEVISFLGWIPYWQWFTKIFFANRKFLPWKSVFILRFQSKGNFEKCRIFDISCICCNRFWFNQSEYFRTK